MPETTAEFRAAVTFTSTVHKFPFEFCDLINSFFNCYPDKKCVANYGRKKYNFRLGLRQGAFLGKQATFYRKIRFLSFGNLYAWHVYNLRSFYRMNLNQNSTYKKHERVLPYNALSRDMI